MAGSLLKIFGKPDNKETECHEDIEVACSSTALNQTEEKDICSSEEASSKTRDEGTTEEPVSSLSSSVSCSTLDCGDNPGLWPASIMILFIFWLIVVPYRRIAHQM